MGCDEIEQVDCRCGGILVDNAFGSNLASEKGK